MIYSAEDLIEEIRGNAGIPAGEVPGYTKAELLAKASSFLRSRLVPLILQKRQDYFIQKVQIALVPGTNDYRIPERAVGDKLRAIWYIDAQGNRQKIDPVALADLHKYSPTSSTLEGFYLTATHIVIVGNPGAGYLEVLFPFRVGDLVLQTDARQVASTPAGGLSVVLTSAAPASWVTGSKIDIHSQLGGHDIRAWGVEITNIDVPRTTLTLNSKVDGSVVGTFPIAVGDWVCLERKSALLALPEEMIPALARGTAQRVAEAEGDAEGMQHHASELEKDAAATLPLVAADRVDAKPQKFFGRTWAGFGG